MMRMKLTLTTIITIRTKIKEIIQTKIMETMIAKAVLIMIRITLK